ncbi:MULTISPECIES: hypothetical protein [Asticcacaulis]|uniref:hypothetical protein n=1 Tax=Asticcacaulis TaxID=76890 RepID=UPI001AEADF52|nr:MULTISPECIES: hypothetical protein [Asticcacaulis]MBP2158209.1 hypothetical protein [Asticcacaulis solisilvae]MDR6799254.1 hypothetical protein [Asticcacaulis sp. BE141]
MRIRLLQQIGGGALIGAVWGMPSVFALVCAIGLCFLDLNSDAAALHFSMFSAALPLVVRFAVDRNLPGFMALAYVAQFAVLLWLGDDLCQALISLRQYVRFG